MPTIFFFSFVAPTSVSGMRLPIPMLLMLVAPVAPVAAVAVLTPLPHQDVDLYLVPCNASAFEQIWRLAPAPGGGGGGVLLQLKQLDPVDHTAICLNCAKDRCHGWTCSSADHNNLYEKQQAPDGNFTLHADGKGDWPATACLASGG